MRRSEQCEADHSPPSYAKVKNVWSSATSPHGVVTDQCQQALHMDENAPNIGKLFCICILQTLISERLHSVSVL
jgi:hypothetical protein